MAERISRGVRMKMTKVDQRKSRIINGHAKRKERIRKDKRMLDIVKAGKLPYTPPIMSWLSVQIDKRSSLIKQEDVDNFLKA
jgi:hypothetical protein